MASSSLYVSTPVVTIDNADPTLMESFRRDILQISVEESLHLPGMFTIVLNNPYTPTDDETKTWQYDSILYMGNTVRLGFIGSTTEARDTDAPTDYIIVGEITAIESHFTNDTQAPIVIRGYDTSHRLHRGRHIRSFQDKTDSDIVKAIAAEVGITATDTTVLPSGPPHEYLFQENQTNMEFLRQRAARIGFELFVQNETLHFRPPTAGTPLDLAWLSTIESFRVRVTAAEQVQGVEVRGWDYRRQTHQEIVARVEAPPADTTATAATTTTTTATTVSNLSLNVGNSQDLTTTQFGPGSRKANTFGTNVLPPQMLLVDKPVSSDQEAEAMAQALWDELGGEFVHADARAPGSPLIRVGKIINLTNMGRYSGTYYITETRHLYHEGIYTTEFGVRGLRGGSLLGKLSSEPKLKPSQTLMVGIVTHNNDPEGLGRVRVRFPTLTPQKDGSAHSSNWARIVSVGAGSGRGLDCIPEINDEVLVGFEHGDICRPYVLGGLWNGQHPRPTPIQDTVHSSGPHQGQVRLRTFRSRVGHMLQFVEDDQNASQSGVHLTTAAGHQMEMNDSDRAITLQTVGQHRIRIDDTNGTIGITTANGQSLQFSDATGSITLNAKGPVNVNANGNITLNPGLGQVMVPGIIQCQQVFTGLGSTLVDLGGAIAALQSSDATQSTALTTIQTTQSTIQTDQSANAAAIAALQTTDTAQTQTIATLQQQALANATTTTA